MMVRARSMSVFVMVIIIVLCLCCVDEVLGRKCVCTSKACRESGAKTCRTRYSCYTELIVSGGEATTTIKTTRGCTEGATPLLCETKSWRSSDGTDPQDSNPSRFNSLDQLLQSGRASAWPRLTCCDSHDYCNAADEDFEPSSSTSTARPPDARTEAGDEASDEETEPRARDYPARTLLVNGAAAGHGGAYEGVQSLHVAALVLAIAALISVFAACYVVTRFLNASGANGGLPARAGTIGPYGNRLQDF